MEVANALSDLAQLVVPDAFSNALVYFAQRTGLAWGPTTRHLYWFQSPKEHIFQFVVVMALCVFMYQQSKGFASRAKATLGARGAGWSVKCPINTLISVVLMLCYASQVYAKGTRAQPLIQLGWLLMPCHVITLMWAWIFLRQRPQDYATNCYLATLAVDWWWSPLTAVLAPDRSDHVFPYESTIFWVHHGLLVGLPVYFAVRYHTLELSRQHVIHLSLVPVFISFGFFTFHALFTGLNLNYMLYPPKVNGLPPVFRSSFYRPAFVLVQIALSVFDNVLLRGAADVVCYIVKQLRRGKQKLS